MLVSRRLGCAFVHVQKTGGESVEAALVQADSGAISRRLGASLRLEHRNASAHVGYRDYYSRRPRTIVAERFARDIEVFGYRF